MRKFLSMVITFIFFMGMAPVSVFATDNGVGTTYYVDYTNGSDENEGSRKSKPWKTLDKVNSMEFQPGDKILFKSGGTWPGVLNPKGSGNENAPIIIDKYDGNSKPRLIGGENEPHVLYLFNEEYWEINNLDISANYTNSMERRGVYIKAEDMGTVNHIYLKDLDIHDVQINLPYQNSNSYKTSGGIFVQITGNTVPTKYDDLVIENCTIEDVDRTGIQLLWSSWANRSSANMGSGRWYPSTNVVVRNNYIKSTAGDGIVVQSTDGAIIEHNTIDDFASRNQGLAYNCAAWSHNADNTIFRFNTGLNGNTTKDGMPWDSDGYSYGTIFEHNYSKNNEGGAYLIISYGDANSSTGLADSRDSIYRYNISENDRFALMTMTNPLGNHKIYNNVFYVGPERKVDAFFYGSMSNKDIGVNFTNNIFYVDEKDGKSGTLGGNWSNKFTYDSNIYYSKTGKAISKLPNDINKITEDPKFIAPGTGENGYKLQSDSPAINSGKYIVDNGGRDYYGNTLYNGIPDIGVYEYSEEVFEIPTQPEQLKVIKNKEIIEILNATVEDIPQPIANNKEMLKYRWRSLDGSADSFIDLEGNSKRTGKNTVFEISIPWNELLQDESVAEIEKVLGFSLVINDADEGDREGWIEFNSGIANGKNPALYGDLVLKEEGFNGSLENGAISAIKTSTVPVLDGTLSDWNTSEPSFVLDKAEQAFTEIKGSVVNNENWTKDDISALGYLKWDDNNLYIAVNVLDDVHKQTEVDNPRAMWKYDSVQMGIDPDRTDLNEGDSVRTEFGVAHYEEFINGGESPEGLIVNGGFEESQEIGHTAINDGWYRGNASQITEVGTEYKYSGNYGVKVVNHAGGGSFLNYKLPLETNKTYKVTAKVKKVSGSAFIRVKWFDPSSDSNNGFDGGIGNSLIQGQWQDVSFEFSTGAEFKAGEPPMLFIGSTNPGEIWIDDVQVVEVNPKINIMVNGDFEASQTVGHTAGKNIWYKNAADHVGEIGEVYKRDGNYGMMVKNRTGAGTFVNYQPTLKTNTVYKLKYDAKKVAGNPQPLKIKYFDPDDSNSNGGYDGGVGAQLSNEWATYEIEFATGTAFKAGEPPMIFIASSPNGEIWIDNVELYEVGAPLPPETGDGEEEPVDLTKVIDLLAEGNEKLQSIVPGNSLGQTPQNAVTRLEKAVSIANEVVKYEFAGVNKKAQDDIELILERAIDVANRTKITENTGNFDENPGLTIGDLGKAIEYMGQEIDVFNSKWNDAKHADFDGNDKIDFIDMMILAEMMLISSSSQETYSSIGSDNEINIGDTVEVVYSMENLQGLVAQDLNIKYDTEVLELVGFNTTIGMKDGKEALNVKKNYHSLGNKNLDGGSRIILGADGYKNALKGSTPIVTLTFKAIGGGNTNIVIDDKYVTSTGATEKLVSIVNEGITVVGSNPEVPEVPEVPEEPELDTEAPVLHYEGDINVNVEYGTEYVIPTVTATDNVDTNVIITRTIKKDGLNVDTVDTTKAGVYVITYTATDNAGNISDNLVVTVTVNSKDSIPGGGTEEDKLPEEGLGPNGDVTPEVKPESKPEEPADKNESELPKTGGTSIMFLLVTGVSIVSIGGILTLKKKKIK